MKTLIPLKLPDTIPSAEEIVHIFNEYFEYSKVKPTDLCRALVQEGYNESKAQLGMQRATDSKHLILTNDLKYKVGKY